MILFILTIIIVTIVVFLLFRNQKYNRYLSNLSRENFESSNKNTIITNIKKTLPSNPNIVFCDYEGNTYFIKENRVWKTNSEGNIVTENNKINLEFNLPYSINIKTGTLCRKNLIILTHDNIIIEYDLIEKEIISNTAVKQYFKELDDEITCMLFYKNKFYLFNNNLVIIYDKDKEQILGTKDANELFTNIPKNINCAYLNNNIIIENVGHGVPCFFKNKDLYIYDEKTKNTNYIDTKYGFMNNTKYFVIEFNNQKSTFIPPKKSLYRIISIGAGNESGGYGGLVYNDYNLNKKDKLEMIVGSSGERLPLKDKIIDHDKLPFTSSSAGSGGSFIYSNNKLLQCSGGGGGWTSEIIKAPNICNSYFSNQIKKNKIVIPIKKLVLKTTNSSYHSNNNIRQKIVIKNFVIDIFNYTQVDYKVETSPSLSKSKFMYETDYNIYGNNSTITITFSKVLSDYSFLLDCKVISTNKDNNNLDLHIYDERDREIIIKDFNKNYNNVNVSSKNIISNFVKYPRPSNENIFIKSGNKSSKKINDLFAEDKSEDDNLDYIKLTGGVGGGGDSYINKKMLDISSGGGGGFVGGSYFSLSEEFLSEANKYLNLEYISGSGGKSYISNSKFDEKHFINDYNNSNGKIIIIQVDKLQSFSQKKDSEKYLKEPQKMIKPKYEPLFEKRMNNVKFNKTKFEITRPSINNDIRFDNINFKIHSKNEPINSGVNYLKFKINRNKFDKNKIFLKCTNNVEVMIMYFSAQTMDRLLFKNNNIKRDNVLSLNHGMVNPTTLNIFSFFEKTLENNIYKYLNSLNINKIGKLKNNNKIEKLFDQDNFIYKNTNYLYIDNNLNKINDVDYLYIIIKSKKECKVKCNVVEYDSKKNILNENDFKAQITNI